MLEEKKSLTEAGNEEANAEPFYIQKTNSSKTVQNSFVWKINNPKLWSAEDPQLYDLTIELHDEAGNIQEVIPQKVGFRRFEMKNGIMTLNGKRIVFKGVNRHEFSSVSGRHVSEEELRKDLRIMKQNNINAIRTCHYPDTSLIYQLCDEYGIYMIDETNLESQYVRFFLLFLPPAVLQGHHRPPAPDQAVPYSDYAPGIIQYDLYED